MTLNILENGPGDAPLTLALAHGAGAPMDAPFMTAMAEGLAEAGLRVLRFEFPYMAAPTAGADRPTRRPACSRPGARSSPGSGRSG